jgi:outer membrane receptor protein involved in Fe transport
MPSLAPLVLVLLLVNGQAPTIDSDDLADLPLEQLARVRVRVVSHVDERTADAPGLVSIVTRRELDLFGASDLAAALDRVVGVGRVTNYFQREIVSVRADALTTASSHVLLLLDGRPIRETQFGGANADLFRMFPLEALDHIEVIRGPGSVLHGSGAYSGVVNLVTREPRERTASFGASGGSFRTADSWASADLPFEGGGARVGVSFHNSDGWPQSFRDVGGRTRAVSLDEAGGSVNAAAHWRGLTAQALFVADREELFSPAPSFPAGMRAFSRLFTDLGYARRLTPALASETHLTLTRFHSPGYNYAAGTENRSDVFGHSEDGVLEETFTITPAPAWDLVAGGLVNRLSGESGRNPPTVPAWSKTWWSAYLSARARPAPSLHLSAGGQVIRASSEELTAVPRLGAVWSHASGWGVKALYGGAYRSPAMIETGVNLPGFLVGNPDLDPETVRTLDLELFRSTATWSWSLALYDSRQTGLIFPDASTSPGTYRNSGRFDSHGAEIEGRFAPSERWYVTGSFALQESSFNDSLDDVTPFPNGVARLGVGFTPSDGVSIGVFDTGYGRPADVGVVRRTRRLSNPVPTATHWLEVQARADLGRLTGSPGVRGLELFARAENLLDQDLWAPEYAQRLINSIPARSGRAFRGGLSFDWGRR